MQDCRRKFYGWGYEDDSASPEEICEFEAAWSCLLAWTSSWPYRFPRPTRFRYAPPGYTHPLHYARFAQRITMIVSITRMGPAP